ncbi:MAG: hypothetical protein FVQ77_00890 [Cytophagales bacterium]|nr:hypothetical protein [Cytophagales bacterium]
MQFTKDRLILDTLTIIPGSIKVYSDPGYDIKIEYDPNTNTVKFTDSPIHRFTDSLKKGGLDSVFICYRVFFFQLNKKKYIRDATLLDSVDYYKEELRYSNIIENREELFSTPGLAKNGNISRGISFGNNQDVSVNSALNLQLNGKLSNDITITAAISDQNVPFQPEGNTRQIQEFDRIYIQLAHEKGKLTAGDLVLNNKPSNFMRFYKNVQGGMVEANLGRNDSLKSTTIVAAAVSKGKFASMKLDVREGVQGPYKLRGPDNEKFIIVIANSEKVFLDGKRLIRGYNYDYVIDYNQAEITFTQRVLITKFSRVRVDFEYSDKNYSRTILNASHYQDIKKFNFFFNYYKEADNPKNPLTISLDSTDQTRLSEIGDNLDSAFTQGVTLVEFNSNQILYKKVDTTIYTYVPLFDSTVYKDIYVYSTDSTDTLYQLVFADVGQGNGNYDRKNSTVNGQIYQWIAPETLTGTLRGRYEPIKIIPTPKKKQMITLGGSYKISKNEQIYGEIAFSDNDINLFSEEGSSDDNGLALKVGYANKGKKIPFIKNYKWHAKIDYEFDEKNFKPLDRYRYIEYDRDWSADVSSRANDNILNLSLGISEGIKNRFNYILSRRKKGEDVDGFQHKFSFAKKLGPLQVNSDLFLMNNIKTNRVSDWKRLNVNANYSTKYFVPGYIYRFDKNEVRSIKGDTVINTAMNFDEHVFYIKNNDTLKTKFSTDYSIRFDHDTLKGKLIVKDKSQTSNSSAHFRLGKNNDLNILATYRKLENQDSTQNIQDEETIMGRFDWNAALFKRHIRSELTYAAGTGRERGREFVFLKVLTGEGTHQWIDFDSNGVQDKNEFSEANTFDERNYIKISVPTDTFIRAFTNSFNYRLNISAPRSWRAKKGLKLFISKFSNITSWSIDKKIFDNFQAANTRNLARFNPVYAITDSNLLSVKKALRTTLFFNRTNPTYGLGFNYYFVEQKQLLTNGFEARDIEEFKVNLRLNIKRKFNTKLLAQKSIKGNTSDYLTQRNYKIRTYKATPEIAFQPTHNIRFTANYSFAMKENIFEISAEKAEFHELGINLRLSKVSKGRLNADLKYINISYHDAVNNDNPNTLVGNRMLEALKPGNNWTWSLNWQQRLANGLQITINYEARKPGEEKIIHIGRMQVSALF